MILTHAHSDHIGMAELVRTDAPATVHVHEADEADGAHRQGRTRATAACCPTCATRRSTGCSSSRGRLGAARTPNITELTTFTDGDLDVPGRPRIIPTPGHSPGHVAFHLPDRGVLIAGDALCTYNPLTGKRGPQLMPRAFAFDIGQAQASLAALERIDAGVLLLGHGEPWTDGPAAAVPARPRIRGHVTARPPILMTRREVAPAA